MRDPDLIEAIEQVARQGGRQVIELVERVPVERTFRIHIAALAGRGWRRPVVLTFEDLSEQRVTERMRVDFVANASHELRTPLASLLGFVETLQGPARNDAGARDRFLDDHARAGPAHGAPRRRPAVAVAHRAARASGAGDTRSISPASRARSSIR